MELTPEERQKIYEEEKARIEARKRIKEEDAFQIKEKTKEKKLESNKTVQKFLAFFIAYILLNLLISSTLKTLFISQETKDELAKEVARVNEENKRIDEANYQIDREKDILWKSGAKGESRKIEYLRHSSVSYPPIYGYFDTISVILSAAIIVAYLLYRNQDILQPFLGKKEPLKFKTKKEYEQWKKKRLENIETKKD